MSGRRRGPSRPLLALLIVTGAIGPIGACGGSDPEPPADANGAVGDGPLPAEGGLQLLSPADGSTLDPAPTFGGLALSGPGDSRRVTVSVRANDGASAPIAELATRRSDQGAFSTTIDTPLPAGEYEARAEQLDARGEPVRSDPRTFTIDPQTPPTLLAAGDIGGCSTTGDSATAALIDRLPGTVAALGDIAYEYGTAAELGCFDAAWGRHRDRIRPVLGDHDYDTRDAAPYFDYFGAAAGERGKGYYSYELGDWHIVALNSNCRQIGGCEPDTPQLRWLRRDLAASDARCTLAYFANPVFSSGEVHGNQRSPIPLWNELYEAGAEVVLSADDHIYERFAPQQPNGTADPERGIREFVVGTGGRSLYGFGAAQPNSEARGGDDFGILKLSLLPDRYRWEFVPEAGGSFTDSGETPCH